MILGSFLVILLVAVVLYYAYMQVRGEGYYQYSSNYLARDRKLHPEKYAIKAAPAEENVDGQKKE